MTLKRLAAVVARHAVFIAVLTGLMVAVTAVVTLREPDEYRSSSLVEVQAPIDTDGSISLQGTLTARERAVTITTLAKTDDVKQRAAEALPAGTRPTHCSVNQDGQSEFISVSCTGQDPRSAAAAAQARAVALQDYLEEQRQARITELNRLYQLQLVSLRRQGVTAENFPPPPVFPSYREVEIREAAEVPTSPFAPTPMRAIAIALVIGLLINTALAFALEYVQDRAHDIEDVERALGEPILGVIPVIRIRTKEDAGTRDGQGRGRGLLASARGTAPRRPEQQPRTRSRTRPPRDEQATERTPTRQQQARPTEESS